MRGAGSLAPGDAVIRLAQPFGRWVKDLLEPQVYPEPRAAVDRPYDVTAWTLGLQMGVTVNRLDPACQSRWRRETSAPATRAHHRQRAGHCHQPSGQRRRHAHQPAVGQGSDGAAGRGRRCLCQHVRPRFPQARPWSRACPWACMEREVADAGPRCAGPRRSLPSSDLVPARRPRVAVIEPWGGAIDAGWTRWVLEQHAFEFTRIRPADLQDRAAAARLDAIVIPDVPSLQLLRGLQGTQTRPEHRGGLEDRGVATLKHFVRAGGTVITLGNAAEFAIDHLDLPAVVASRTDDADTALVPGTLLRATLVPDHPVNAGMPSRGCDVMNVMNNAYAPGRGAEGLRAIAQYPDEPLVASGYATGESRLRGRLAAFDVAMGRGRIVVLGFRVQHRAQTWGTFKMLFNAIFLAGTGPPAFDPQTIDN